MPPSRSVAAFCSTPSWVAAPRLRRPLLSDMRRSEWRKTRRITRLRNARFRRCRAWRPSRCSGASLALPKELKPIPIARAVEYVERETADLIDLYLEQANVFSAIIGIFGVKGLHAVSPYKKHKHPDVAQQRFPDLSLNGRLNPPPKLALESKGSTRPWAIQSHYDHPGWYVVWRYMVDPTGSIKPNRPIIIWRVDMIF